MSLCRQGRRCAHRLGGVVSTTLLLSRRYQTKPAGPAAHFVSELGSESEEERLFKSTTFVDIDPENIRRLAKEGIDECCDTHARQSVSLLPPSERSKRPESSLSMKERRRLSEMIYETHYRSEVVNGAEGLKAMMYQAALEVKFIEDAIETLSEQRSQGGGEAFLREEVRHRIKKAVLERCDLHKPLSYIIGYQPFYGCHIDCVAPLLCPRPETEMWTHWLVGTYLQRAKEPFSVVDVCSGTGCIGVAIAKNAPKANVLALDILPEAVETSTRNAMRNHVFEDRYQCVLSNMFQYLESNPTRCPQGTVDVLVSNPPYILPEQYKELPATITHWESRVALVGSPDREDRQYTYFQDLCEKGATYCAPAESRQWGLKEAPSLVIEIGLQGERVASIVEQHPAWMDVELHTDFAGQPRWVTARRR